MGVGREKIRRGWLLAFVALMLAVLAPIVLRSALERKTFLVEIVFPGGGIISVLLEDAKRIGGIEREGVYQNQYGNWRDDGVYQGVLLSELIGTNVAYDALLVTAADGYAVRIERSRVEDSDYPMVLAYRFNGTDVPAWEDGPRIAVLPEDGDVSNAEYDAESAGSYWVKDVHRIELLADSPSSREE
ncbi:hypothetical protein JW848_01830 [Candidatus Bipolaricaulota bacterium]|nr:hypothetical protein [Candidatus Bipolaricaulota bacterium]